MIAGIRYAGPLITDTSVPGERKADGILPAHGNGALQLSEDRWALFASTLDTNGWDTVKSVIYQIRADAPDGPLLNEGLLAGSVSDWRPFEEKPDLTFRKVFGMPMAFGVPKGARINGKPAANENVFGVITYRRAAPERDGIVLPRAALDRPEFAGYRDNFRLPLLRCEWAQFRLNDAGDDIEILQPVRTLMQKGYDREDHFCDLGPSRFMNHAMTPPQPSDPGCMRWTHMSTFDFDEVSGHQGHGKIAPIEFEWNAQTGLYEWTRVGELHWCPGRAIGEPSLSRWDDGWLIATRSNCIDGSTLWYRAGDLFGDWSEPVIRPQTWGPRHSYRCPDGVLRIFLNDQGLSPEKHKRNPLYMFEVDPNTLDYSDPITVFDAPAEGIPFAVPFADMSKLCPNQGRRQLLAFRLIHARMTTGADSPNPEFTDEDLAGAGVHACEITYDDDVPDPWTFGPTR